MVEEMGGLHAVQRLMLVGLQDDGLAGDVVVVHVRAHPQSGLREALFQLQTEVHLLHLIGIIDDLSAVSQQNAAGTEETNAAMEELNASFHLISDNAKSLQEIADELSNEISYFRLS